LYPKIKKYMNQQLALPNHRNHPDAFWVLLLCVYVVLRVGQAVGGMELLWRTLGKSGGKGLRGRVVMSVVGATHRLE
jgi:hypothetical protein